jgi:ATP-dependent DNA helicase PIF1
MERHLQTQTQDIQFPHNFCNIVCSVDELKANMFPDIHHNYRRHEWLCERAILAPKNDCVHILNLQIQNTLPKKLQNIQVCLHHLGSSQAVLYPVEFLNSLEHTGIPPHNLELKIEMPIMLLQNLDPLELCYGTRLCVKNLNSHVIEATVLTVCAKGKHVFIPRIPLIPTDLPFDFKRIQFPVRLAFAMSIN